MKVALGLVVAAMLNQPNVDVAAQGQGQNQENFHQGHDQHDGNSHHDGSWQPPEVCFNPHPTGQRYWKMPHCWNPDPICWHHDGSSWQQSDGWHWQQGNSGFWQTNDDHRVGQHETCYQPSDLDWWGSDDACWYAPKTCWNPKNRNKWKHHGQGRWEDNDHSDDDNDHEGSNGGYSNGGSSGGYNQGGYNYPGR